MLYEGESKAVEHLGNAMQDDINVKLMQLMKAFQTKLGAFADAHNTKVGPHGKKYSKLDVTEQLMHCFEVAKVYIKSPPRNRSISGGVLGPGGLGEIGEVGGFGAGTGAGGGGGFGKPKAVYAAAVVNTSMLAEGPLGAPAPLAAMKNSHKKGAGQRRNESKIKFICKLCF